VGRRVAVGAVRRKIARELMACQAATHVGAASAAIARLPQSPSPAQPASTQSAWKLSRTFQGDGGLDTALIPPTRNPAPSWIAPTYADRLHHREARRHDHRRLRAAARAVRLSALRADQARALL